MADDLDPPDAREAYEAMQAELEQLRADLAAARSSGANAADVAALRVEIETLKAELAAARTPPPEPEPVPREKRVDGFFEVE